MTASNQTYRRLSSQPSSGTGMPQSMSRVIGRPRSPSSTKLRLKRTTFGRQCGSWVSR